MPPLQKTKHLQSHGLQDGKNTVGMLISTTELRQIDENTHLAVLVLWLPNGLSLSNYDKDHKLLLVETLHWEKKNLADFALAKESLASKASSTQNSYKYTVFQ